MKRSYSTPPRIEITEVLIESGIAASTDPQITTLEILIGWGDEDQDW